MVLKDKLRISGRRSYLVLGFIVIALLLIASVVLINKNNSEQKPTKEGYTLPNYSYTFQSSDVKCQVVPSYPGSKTTINDCRGKLVTTNKSGESKTYSVSFTSTLYRNGALMALDQLDKLQPGKTKLAITFLDAAQQQVKTVAYVE